MDFTSLLDHRAHKFYNGANGSKVAVRIGDDLYMLKFPQGKEEIKRGYTNSCIAEYLGSGIFSSAGIPAQKVLLGTVDLGGEERIAAACKDFTGPGTVFYDFLSVKNACIRSSKSGASTELSEIKDAMEEQTLMPKEEVSRRFWDMFVVDALIGNFNRHNGNWGFLVDAADDKAELAPVFGCGSSLLSKAMDERQRFLLNDKKEMDERIYIYPTSAVRIDGARINYHDFLTAGTDGDCMDAVKRMVPGIDLDRICDVVDACPYISDLNKTFYKTYVRRRYEQILLPAYQSVA